MVPDSFLAGERLWLLLLLPVLVGLYAWRGRRRHAYALRFSALPMLGQVAPRRPGWRRHLVAAGTVLALAVVVVAFARPAADTRVPRERATVVLAIDVSLSMNAEDVAPNRLEAAQQAARQFADDLPPSINLGLVTFAGSATVLVPPTTDRARVKQAVDSIRLGPYTAIGEGIFTGLQSLDQVPPDPSGEPVPAHLVVLSDGETTVGRANSEAVAAAVEAGVPVSTIAFGTPGGTVVIEGVEEPVPVNEDELRTIADDAGGSFYEAETLGELEDVYADIGSSIGYETVPSEITDRWVGLALATLLLCVAGSLVWFGRLA
ncbi:VWA domain-containing protein [Angustibacter speluncae]